LAHSQNKQHRKQRKTLKSLSRVTDKTRDTAEKNCRKQEADGKSLFWVSTFLCCAASAKKGTQ
jgi:hypothetical protein